MDRAVNQHVLVSVSLQLVAVSNHRIQPGKVHGSVQRAIPVAGSVSSCLR